MMFVHNYEEEKQICEDARNSKHLTNAAMCPICNKKPKVLVRTTVFFSPDNPPRFLLGLHIACLECGIHGSNKSRAYHAVKAWNTMVRKITEMGD